MNKMLIVLVVVLALGGISALAIDDCPFPINGGVGQNGGRVRIAGWKPALRRVSDENVRPDGLRGVRACNVAREQERRLDENLAGTALSAGGDV